MGLPHRFDYLEIELLKLTAEHFPLPCSLLKAVRVRYTDLEVSAADEQAMSREELLDYIRQWNDLKLTPLDGILTQTEAIGDPALPTAEQVAILRWLGTALQDWERSYPIEEPLASQVRQLKPLLAALAITSPDFLVPGAHPIQRILDTIQSAAIGWQPRLGRASQALERQVGKVVETALTWFDDMETDLAQVCSELTTAAERDQTRTQRMARRVVETEQGRGKTVAAKRQAAQMINAALEQFETPAGIGEFLKGPWYASAQLLLLKHGSESEEWQQMSATTHTLLDSLQPSEDTSEERRQEIFQLVTQLPKDLKRWLLNLHHDSEAVDDAVGLVEFAHLRVLRQQPMAVEKVDAIPLETKEANPDGEARVEAVDAIETGQWFLLSDDQGPLRAQLVLKMEDEQQLLFINQAGIKVLQLDYREFADRLAQDQATPLESHCSFSWSLANAVGIATARDLDEFTGVAAEKARLAEEERLRKIEEALRLEQAKIAAELAEKQRMEAERLEQERLEKERMEAERREQERLEQERLEAERAEKERQEQERLDAQRRAEEERRAAEAAEEEARKQAKIEEYRRQKRERQERYKLRASKNLPGYIQDDSEEEEKKGDDGVNNARHDDLNLPMGAWIGFHDGDTPLLAKLALHDREQDLYFFVNRLGIKMRQLSSGELHALMERGLVDILERNSNFREEVTRMNSESEEE